MLTLHNTHFVTVETDLNRPNLKTLSLSAARFGIHIRVLHAYPDNPEHGNTKHDFITVKMKTLLDKLDIPPDDYAVYHDANDTVFVKGQEDLFAALNAEYRYGKVTFESKRRFPAQYKGQEKHRDWERRLQTESGYKPLSSAFMFGKWASLQAVLNKAVQFGEAMRASRSSAEELVQQYSLPKELAEALIADTDKTMAFDDETATFLTSGRDVEITEKITSSCDKQPDCPVHHWAGRHKTKVYLGGMYGVFPQPPQPVPLPRCQFMQMEFPRHKWLEQRPCKGDAALCTYAGIVRGANTCRPVTKTKDKNGQEQWSGCPQFLPLAIEPTLSK